MRAKFMWKDPIVDEIHKIRRRLSAKFNHDIKAICDYIRELGKKSGRTYVTLPPRPARKIKLGKRRKGA